MFGVNSQSTKDKKLHDAIHYGKLDEAEAWLKKGANVDAVFGSDGYSLLWRALSGANGRSAELRKSLVQLLLDHNINIDYARKDDQTALHAAAKDGYRPIVTMLIEAGADITAQDEDGNTPIYMALRRSEWLIADDLINAGALDHATKNYSDFTVLMHAASRGTPEPLFRKIIAACPDDLNAVDNDGDTALHLVATSPNSLRILLSCEGIKVSEANHRGATALYKAVYDGNEECAKLLLDAGADPRIERGEYITAFEYAASANNIAILKDIITTQRERAPDGLGEYISRAFVVAAENNAVGALEYLMEQGADLNYTDNKRMTAVMHAAHHGQAKTVEILLNAGASCEGRSVDGYTLDDYAEDSSAVVRVIKKSKKSAQLVMPTPVASNDGRFKKLDDHAIEVISGGLSMTFNFWTQQVITRNPAIRQAPPHIQNFEDVQRRGAVLEAFNKLKEMNGTPPEPDMFTSTFDKKASMQLTGSKLG